jgi:tRNA U38,U39,U40 pseudouridine synthase TruA
VFNYWFVYVILRAPTCIRLQMPTVAGILHEAISGILAQPPHQIAVAGRTDAGVSAVSQAFVLNVLNPEGP